MSWLTPLNPYRELLLSTKGVELRAEVTLGAARRRLVARATTRLPSERIESGAEVGEAWNEFDERAPEGSERTPGPWSCTRLLAERRECRKNEDEEEDDESTRPHRARHG